MSDLYDTYAARLFEYGLWVAGDADVAENAVYGALLAALGQPSGLAESTYFTAWLYGLTRAECARGGARRETPGAVAFLERHAPRRATATLDESAHDVAELILRHRLTAVEVAAVLHWREGKVRKALGKVSDMVAAAGGDDVVESVAARPWPRPPEPLYGRLVSAVAIPSRIAYFTERARAYGAVPTEAKPSPVVGRAAVIATVSAVVLLLAAALSTGPGWGTSADDQDVGGSLTPSGSRPVGPVTGPGDGWPATLAPPPTTIPSATRPAAGATLRTPSSARANRAAPAPRPSPVPAPRTPRSPAGPVVSLDIAQNASCTRNWSAYVRISVSDGSGQDASVTWSFGGGQGKTRRASQEGVNNFETYVPGLPENTPISFRATVTTTNGRTLQSPTRTVSVDC